MKKIVYATILVLGVLSLNVGAREPEWNVKTIKPCDRSCLVDIMNTYLAALVNKDRSSLPLALDVHYTENTARLDVGEGVLWRGKLEQTSFKYYVADPQAGQVAVGTVLRIEGRPALVAIRLRVERHRIMEIEHLYDRSVAPEAMELLHTPVPLLTSDVPAAQRTPRYVMVAAANAYFAALTGEDGKIAPFARDCVRHENGYQTVNNKKPGRAAPAPPIPPPDSLFGRLSVMTCEQQIDTRIFSGIKKIWPRRILVVDEQKGVVATFPLFIHDGTRRTSELVGLPKSPMTGGMGMVLNMVTMESFAIRNGRIKHVEAFPFVILPYGLGNGWTEGSGR